MQGPTLQAKRGTRRGRGKQAENLGEQPITRGQSVGMQSRKGKQQAAQAGAAGKKGWERAGCKAGGWRCRHKAKQRLNPRLRLLPGLNERPRDSGLAERSDLQRESEVFLMKIIDHLAPLNAAMQKMHGAVCSAH